MYCHIQVFWHNYKKRYNKVVHAFMSLYNYLAYKCKLTLAGILTW